MKVAMVSEHASPLAALGGADAGGQNVHVAALAAAMGRCDVAVTVHTRRDSPELPQRVAMSAGVTIEHVDAGPAEEIPKDRLLPHMDEFAERLATAWRRDRPDVVHAHFWMSGYAALKAATSLGIPVLQTFHALGAVKRRYQGDKDTSPPERMGIEHDLMRRAAHVVATCTDEVFELVRLGASQRRLTVIPCGVDLQLFRPEGPVAPRRSGRRRLVCVGRLVERKGIGNAVSALALVPDAELIVAGGPEAAGIRDDPEARRLMQLAEKHGVGDRVELCGRLDRSQVPPLIRSADAVVSVPWYEPFGIVPLEAMACGVPVVASGVGGMVDSVVDGLTGVHVAPRDPERLASALRPLLDEPQRRRELGRAGVERARRLYDWNRIAAGTLDVYARVRRTPRRRSAGDGRFELPASGSEHLASLLDTAASIEAEVERLEALGRRLAERLLDGGRLIAAGNGGSAAQAQHLTAELVGRYETERSPLSAICLHGDTSSLTAICNDYGLEEGFARQVRAHGRPGDVLVGLSTSGRSPNLLAAARAAHDDGLEVWAITGPRPNPLAELADECICIDCPRVATVQELHLVAIHLLCGAVDREVALSGTARSREVLA